VYSIEEILEATNTLLNKKSLSDNSINKVEVKEFVKPNKIKLNTNEIKQLNVEMNKLFESFIHSTSKSIINNN
jgi:peptidoglycan biosynthesis protein MviN/MurJ (putative lipid II flippase)